jgi:hypothetical protein
MKIVVLIVFIITFSTLSAQTLQRNWGVEYRDSVQKVLGRMIASDNDGNVCVSLSSDSSFTYMLKYNKDGEIEWIRSSYDYPEQFKVRQQMGVGQFEYDSQNDVYHLVSVRPGSFGSPFGKLLSLTYENKTGTSHGFIPPENSRSLLMPSVVIKSNDNLFFDSKLLFNHVDKQGWIFISSYDKFSRLYTVDTIKVVDSLVPQYSLLDTKINQFTNSMYHLLGLNIDMVAQSMFVLSKTDISNLENSSNEFLNNDVYIFTSSDLGVPTHSLLVRKLLLKDDKIYVCGMSLSKIRMYHPFIATISTNGELVSVDFPYGKEGSTLPRDYCFSSDSSAIILAGENYDLINTSIYRPTVKGYSLVTKDTFSYDENDRLGRFTAVTATSNGTIVATGRDITGGPDHYMYTASYSGIPLSVQEKSVKPQIAVSPNPSSGLIRLSVSEAINGTLTISNIYGHEMLKLKDYQLSSSIDVSRLPSGFYFISYGDREKLTTSFVLTK